MSSARLSITVPEALWRKACPPGASASKVVQEGLHLLVIEQDRRLAAEPFDGRGVA
jgi:hypothetical protein